MSETTAAGAKILIGPANSVANDAAAYGLLSYVEIGSLVDIGDIGDTFNQVTSDHLNDRRTKVFKGQKSGGVNEVVFDLDDADTGQNNLITAGASDDEYAFKVTLDNSGGTGPTTFFFRAIVMGTPTRIGSAGNMVRRRAPLSIVSKVVEVAAS